MNLALITRIFDPSYGGLEQFQFNLASMIMQKGIDLTIFAEKWVEPKTSAIRMMRVKPAKNPLAPNTVNFATSARRMLVGNDFECVLSNTPFYPCDIHRAGGGIHKFWYQFRQDQLGGMNKFVNYLPRYRYALQLEKNIFDPANVKFQIANSRLLKDQMIAYYNFPEDRISVIHNGIDFKKFDYNWCRENRKKIRKQMNFSENDFVILFPSNNFKRKGLGVLLEALKKAKYKKQCVLMAVGRDKLKSGNVRIRFEGHQQNLAPYYAASDCLILPTMYEPCSNVVLEAMACGLVPVTSPTNGASEFIVHGKNGFILSSWKDTGQLKIIIEDLCTRKNELHVLGFKAYESVRGYTLEKNAKEIIGLCKRAAILKDV